MPDGGVAGPATGTPPNRADREDARHARHRPGRALLDPAIAEAIGALRNPDTAAAASPLAANLLDLGEQRLAAMDAAGIDLQVISHTTPGVQHLDDAETAVTLAREANDELARAVDEHPDRFAAFATLPTPDPGAAADELERAVGELGMKGAMVNGHTGGRFLDDPTFDVLLARFERLGVPLYLHPAEPVPAVRDAYYAGFNPAVRGSWARPPGAGTRRPACTSCAWSSAACSIAIPGCGWWSATWARCSPSCWRASTTTCRPR